MQINSKGNRVSEHVWFAWHPVLATERGPDGLIYRWVWLENVRRKFSRTMAISQWTYEIL